MKKERSAFIDILKAIGIISIVIGHSGWTITSYNINIGGFVYTYHIMIFILTAGYCFKESDAETPYLKMGKRLKGLLPMYVGYNFLFTILHNLLNEMHILSEESVYTMEDIVVSILSSFVFITQELFLGAFWFVPVLFITDLFFVLIFNTATKAGKYKNVIHILAICCFAILGIYFNTKNMLLPYHMQTSLLAIPIMYVGYWLKNNLEKVKKYFGVIGGGLSVLLLSFILNQTGKFIELSVNKILSPALFYPVTLLGMYFCMCLATLIEKNTITRQVFSYIGKNCFHIMALHFLCLKLVDFVYYHMMGMDEVSVLMTFPFSFNIKPVYYVVGVGLPLLLAEGFRRVKSLCTQT